MKSYALRAESEVEVEDRDERRVRGGFEERMEAWLWQSEAEAANDDSTGG